MNVKNLFLIACMSVPLTACFDNDHPPPGGGGLAAEVKAPLDKAAGVDQMVEDQDAAQRKAMDEQGK